MIHLTLNVHHLTEIGNINIFFNKKLCFSLISSFLSYLAHSYLAEAQLYLEKTTESIEHLIINSRIESDKDISFAPTSISNINEPNESADGVISNDPEYYARSKRRS